MQNTGTRLEHSMDRIEARAAFDHIRYANCWEDAEILCRALNPEPGKRILSIASAGDNSLSLLAGGAEVVAVDLNPSQLACLELRRAAVRNLDYDEYLGFFGIRKMPRRKELYKKLKKDLNKNAAGFWDNNPSGIEQGFIHNGKFERYFHLFRTRILPLVHSRSTVLELLREKDRNKRIEFYDKKWNNFRWRMLFRIFFSRGVMGKMGRDPEFFRYVDGPVSEQILKRTRYALTELPTHDNPYLDYILTGNYTYGVPHYLQPENFEKIRNSFDNLTVYQGTVQDAANHYGNDGFDGFNLSDIFEYLDPPTCRNIYNQLLEKARGGARFAYWNMLVPRRMSDDFPDRVNWLEDVSRELFASDKAFFYSRFVVEEVR